MNLETLRRAATGQLTLPPQLAPALNAKHVSLILVLATLLGLGGLAILFGGLIVLATGSLIDTNSIAPVIVLLAMAGITGITIIVSRLLRMIPTAGVVIPPESQSPPRMPKAQSPAVLPPPMRAQEMPSVAEHTTHHLQQYAPPREREPHS